MMRVLDGERVLVRMFVGEGDRWHHQPLYLALVERLRKEGFAGATVLRGISGFGARNVLHTTHLIDVAADLPVVLEVVETPEEVRRMEPIFDEMAPGALVTHEKVRVVRPGKR
jgi:PII-like signaling protein